MPEVGISGLPLDYPHSGSAVYVRNLVRELSSIAGDLTPHLFTRWAAPEHGVPGTKVSSPFAALNRGRGVTARADKLAWEIGALPAASALRRQALLHSTYFAAPLAAASPIVVTVHDVIPLVVPGYHRSRQAQMYSAFMAWNVPRAAGSIITVSDHAKSGIMRVLRVPERRVTVTYEGVERRYHAHHPAEALTDVRRKYRLPERFVLYLGGAERRKNIETLVRAWRRAQRSLADREMKLVIVARFPPPDALYPDVPGLVQELGLQDDVVLISHVDEVDKPPLYALAALFCFPSRYEGFGFPPLEAMASGIPVVASDASSLPEVLGDAAYLVPPDDVASWSEALIGLTDSATRRHELAMRGLARAALFTWEQTARRTLEVYEGLLG